MEEQKNYQHGKAIMTGISEQPVFVRLSNKFADYNFEIRELAHQLLDKTYIIQDNREVSDGPLPEQKRLTPSSFVDSMDYYLEELEQSIRQLRVVLSRLTSFTG